MKAGNFQRTNPANIRLDEDVLKTSFVFVFRRRFQDVFIKTNIFAILITSSEDVFKTSWSRPVYSSWSYVFKTSSRRLAKTSSRRFQDVFKMFSRRLAKTSSRHLAKTSSRYLQDVFKTSSKRLRDVLKTSWRRFEDVLKTQETQTVSRRFQDVSLSYTVLVKKFSRCPQDVFTTFLRRTAKTVIYRRICLGHTFVKFKVSVQNL